MNLKRCLLLCTVCLFGLPLFAQFTFTKGAQVLEISGALNSYYNYRFYDTTATNFRKNRFRMRDAHFKLEGRFGNSWAFQLEMDFASLDIPDDEPSTTNPFLNDAFVEYRSPFGLRAALGYQKVPYSRINLVPIFYSPFMKRPVYADGNFFHRRDVGLNIEQSFAIGTIFPKLYLGLFNGTGSLDRNNDPSGGLEYAGRLEVAWPATFKYREVDLDRSPVPQLVLSVNSRYSDLITPSNSTYPVSIDGKRWLYGGDLIFRYKGFVFMAEVHQSKNTPRDSASVYLNEKPTSYFLTGGTVLAANYYIKVLKSVIAVRYEEVNPNDLITGNFQRTFSVAYNFLLKEYNTVLRLQYWNRFQEPRTGFAWKRNEIRVGLQLLIL